MFKEWSCKRARNKVMARKKSLRRTKGYEDTRCRETREKCHLSFCAVYLSLSLSYDTMRIISWKVQGARRDEAGREHLIFAEARAFQTFFQILSVAVEARPSAS